MALPILKIAKVLARLTVLAPVASEGVEKIRTLVEAVRGDAAAAGQLDALKEAVELQSAINEEVAEQLRGINVAVEDIRRSLKVWAFVIAGTAVAAVAALAVALLK